MTEPSLSESSSPSSVLLSLFISIVIVVIVVVSIPIGRMIDQWKINELKIEQEYNASIKRGRALLRKRLMLGMPTTEQDDADLDLVLDRYWSTKKL